MEKIIGTVSAGSSPLYGVVDLEDDFYIEIRSVENSENKIKIPKQSAHVLADILKKVEVK